MQLNGLLKIRLGSTPSFKGLKIAMHTSGEKRREI